MVKSEIIPTPNENLPLVAIDFASFNSNNKWRESGGKKM